MKRTMMMVFLALLLIAGALDAAAQDNLKGEHDITVGLLGIDGKGNAYFVDLSRRDPTMNTPYLIYLPKAADLGLKVGVTYSAHLKSSADMSIVVNGRRIHPKGLDLYFTPEENVQTWSCDKRPAPEGGHWEWMLPERDGPGCKPGVKEAIKWERNKTSELASVKDKKYKNLPRCISHPGHTNWNFDVVIKVEAAAGKHWTFDEAPSVIAQRFLTGMNDNPYSIKFKEPNGSYPDFTIHITLNETNDGTRRDEAWASVVGPYEVTSGITNDIVENFREKSGDAPFTSWQDAIDRLSQNVAHWFNTGWHNNPPCIQSDGSVREN